MRPSRFFPNLLGLRVKNNRIIAAIYNIQLLDRFVIVYLSKTGDINVFNGNLDNMVDKINSIRVETDYNKILVHVGGKTIAYTKVGDVPRILSTLKQYASYKRLGSKEEEDYIVFAPLWFSLGETVSQIFTQSIEKLSRDLLKLYQD